MTITQHYQYGKVADEPVKRHLDGKEFDRLLDQSEVFEGRPTLANLVANQEHGMNIVWLYTKIAGQPELVDAISLR